MTDLVAQNEQQTSSNSSALSMPLHANAALLVKQYANDFAERLIIHSQSIAFEQRDDEVQSSHIREALDIIRREPTRKRWKELLIFFSSVFLGYAIQGLLTELPKFSENPPSGSPNTLITYLVLTVVSSVAATVAILK